MILMEVLERSRITNALGLSDDCAFSGLGWGKLPPAWGAAVGTCQLGKSSLLLENIYVRTCGFGLTRGTGIS